MSDVLVRDISQPGSITIDGANTVVVESDVVHVTTVQDIELLVVESPRTDVVRIHSLGPQGPPGPTGPQGPAGTGGDLTFVYEQITPAAIWAIDHDLNKFPSVTITQTNIDGNDEVVYGEIVYIDSNTIWILFTSAQIGKVFFN